MEKLIQFLYLLMNHSRMMYWSWWVRTTNFITCWCRKWMWTTDNNIHWWIPFVCVEVGIVCICFDCVVIYYMIVLLFWSYSWSCFDINWINCNFTYCGMFWTCLVRIPYLYIRFLGVIRIDSLVLRHFLSIIPCIIFDVILVLFVDNNCFERNILRVWTTVKLICNRWLLL